MGMETIRTNSDHAQLMFEALASCGYEPFAYSGRSMYGAACVAARFANPVQGMACVATALLETHAADDAKEILEAVADTAKWDSLGTETVIYFPELAWDAAWEDEVA